MTIEHDLLCATSCWFDDIDDHWASSLWSEHVLGKTLDLKFFHILVDTFHSFFYETIGEELSIIVWAEVWNSDEILKTLDVPVVPGGINILESLFFVEDA